MRSIWQGSTTMPSFPALDGDKKCDVLIIGGGIAGILCAYMLEKQGIDYILVESDVICNKTTANTTAKITSLHGFIYGRLLKEFNRDIAKLYYEANEDAISKYKKLCKNIDCDFVECDSYIYTFDNKNKLENEFNALEKIGIDCELVSCPELPFDTLGAIKFKNQASFNPLKFLKEISKDLNIYENTHIDKIKGTTAYTEQYRIDAKKIVFATHFPFMDKHGLYFAKMYQEKSYALALENTKKFDGMYIDDKGILSLRSYGDYLIFGGQKHRTGKKCDGFAKLEELANKYFPGNKIKCKWATEDCITLDGIPYIGKYYGRNENIYVITGFNKWGMTSSMVGAELICDLISGKENKYEKLFSPQRSILKKQLIVNMGEALVGILNFSNKRCTHLGCRLKWNKNEKIWECPCHGSKFDSDGEVLNGPANKNL